MKWKSTLEMLCDHKIPEMWKAKSCKEIIKVTYGVRFTNRRLFGLFQNNIYKIESFQNGAVKINKRFCKKSIKYNVCFVVTNNTNLKSFEMFWPCAMQADTPKYKRDKLI